MADKITVYQCPACTGPLHFDGKAQKLKCDYCGSLYTVEEMEALFKDKNAGAEAAAAAESAAADSAAAPSGDDDFEQQLKEYSSAGNWGGDAAHMRAYNCTSCGAELICDDTTAASSCPYCGNPTIMPGSFSGVDRPDYVIPFKIDKKEAVDALKNYYKGKTLLPGEFASGNHIEEIQGVYVPFWLFSGEVRSQMQFDARKEDKQRVGDEEITNTQFFDVRRDGTLSFDKIPVDSSTKMPDDLMDSIEPFDYREMKPFAMEYMPGYMANRYDVKQEVCWERAKKRAVGSTHDAIRDTVKGYTSVGVVGSRDQVKETKTEYGMLPVWLLSTRWNDQTFLFAMNGQSGRMTGDLPVSKPKKYGIMALVFAALFCLFNFVVFKNSNNSYLISAIIGAIAALITGSVMQSNMKPVAQKTRAGNYVDPMKGLVLHSQSDQFLRKQETRTKVQSGGQPSGGKPSGGQPSGGKPSGGKPAGGKPSGGQPGKGGGKK